jgi:DNA-binding CsgD family transcriptional regulator
MIDTDPLTPRELQVLDGAARGETAQQTSERLGIEGTTVKYHRTGLMRKLGTTTIAGAVAIGVRRGLIHGTDAVHLAAALSKPSPLEVIEATVRKHGRILAPHSVVLGFLIGRNWPDYHDNHGFNPEKLRVWIEEYCQMTEFVGGDGDVADA